MKTIYITQLLGRDLKSRSTVGDLKLYVNNLNDNKIHIDFSDVQFATRSFIDEFYNSFIKNQDKEPNIKIALDNISYDIQAIFDAVSKTQKGQKKPSSSQSSVHSFDNISEAIKFLDSLPV
jgi:hypothetical protein